ncbi:MAG: hypothetical protein BGO54_00870 [Sphingobacteriales bacterium 46-32]|nr:MAG: hypothetical protein BGO54_00870 [Sphingobacteriales bacterium 46-32]
MKCRNTKLSHDLPLDMTQFEKPGNIHLRKSAPSAGNFNHSKRRQEPDGSVKCRNTKLSHDLPLDMTQFQNRETFICVNLRHLREILTTANADRTLMAA